MEKDLKLQNEIKIKTAHLNQDEVAFNDLRVIVKSFFGDDIDFDPNKDWNISFAIKNDDKGLRNFSGALKMSDTRITGEQLQIFSYNPAKEFNDSMQAIVNGDSGVDSISISGSGFEERVIAKRKTV